MATLATLEVCLLHLRLDVRCTDHYTFQLNQFVDMGRVELANSVRFHHVVWSYLNNLVCHVVVGIHG